MSTSQTKDVKSRVPVLPLNHKTRGANRSTKVAGKLKILPEEQPVSPELPRAALLPPPRRETAEGSTTVGDSDEDEGDDEEELDDVDVSSRSCSRPPGYHPSHVLCIRSTTKSTSSQRAQQDAMHCA